MNSNAPDTTESLTEAFHHGDAFERKEVQRKNPALYAKLEAKEKAAFMEGFNHDDQYVRNPSAPKSQEGKGNKPYLSKFPHERARQQAIYERVYGGGR